jgi:hypothetical protein
VSGNRGHGLALVHTAEILEPVQDFVEEESGFGGVVRCECLEELGIGQGVSGKVVLPHLKCGQAAKPVGYRKPTDFIQDLSPLKTTEDLSPEGRGSAPGCPLRSGVTKTAGFSVELIVSNIRETVYKLSGAVQTS